MVENDNRIRRVKEQKWLINKMIELLGVDYSWPLTNFLLCSSGLDLYADAREIQTRITRSAHISKQLVRLAEKREAMAKKAEEEGHLVTARDNYYSASVCYVLAYISARRDAIDRKAAYNAKKIECYDKFIKYAPHQVQRVEIPFEGKSLPGLLHLPRNRTQTVPCVVEIGGSHISPEMLNPVYNDKYLERGMAALALDGPGQGETALRNIMLSIERFGPFGRAVMDFLIKRPEIDSRTIVVRGISLGSGMAVLMAAGDDRYKAAAAHGVLFKPFGYSSGRPAGMRLGGDDEQGESDSTALREFYEYEGYTNIKCPLLIIIGEDDEMAPENSIEYAYNIFNKLTSPTQLMVYEGEEHTVRHTYDTDAMIADWLKDRLEGKAIQSKKIYIESSGREITVA